MSTNSSSATLTFPSLTEIRCVEEDLSNSNNLLSKETHELARHYLSGAVGRENALADFKIDPAFFDAEPTQNQHYAEAVRTIATHAPLRILPCELLVGSATLQEAMEHNTPLTPFPSISHTTIDFEKALKIGYAGFRLQIEQRLNSSELREDERDLLVAMHNCINAALIWHRRYVASLEEQIAVGGVAGDHVKKVLKNLRRVPEQPPKNFREAVQALWSFWDFQRLCGNWSGIGRIDKMLGGFLRRDLDAGRIDRDEAREFLAHFWIKGCEWITAEGRGSGDAQFYQNIILGGVDEEGEYIWNEVSDLVLDVVEELHISDFPIAVRIDKKSPPERLQRIACIQRQGGGIVAIYNDDQIIPSLVKFGYPIEEARNYTNDGCWEILIPGKTYFGYQPFDMLLLLQETLGLSEVKSAEHVLKNEYPKCVKYNAETSLSKPFTVFEDLYTDFRGRIFKTLNDLTNDKRFNPTLPCPLISLMVDGCIARGRSYLNDGPQYTVLSPHAGGIPDAANSLLTIRQLVFEEKSITLAELTDALRSNWEGNEELRRRIQAKFSFFGNGDPEADAMATRIFNDFTDSAAAFSRRHGVLRPAGISTFGREMSEFIQQRTATASGQCRNDILASNFSPSPGTDKCGPTAVIRSHCAVDFDRLPCGTALDLKINPDSLRGKAGLKALTGMMQTFVKLGGIFMQIDVVDTELLRKAQANPEKYPNLSVRISGWSARFATLANEWQEIVINRTEQYMRHK